MLWVTLFHKIGKQQLKFTQHNHVYALLENPKTHEVEKVYLNLKYDASGIHILYVIIRTVRTERDPTGRKSIVIIERITVGLAEEARITCEKV